MRSDTPPHRVINFVWYRNYPIGGPFEDLMRADTKCNGLDHATGTIREEHLPNAVHAPSWRHSARVVIRCDEPLIQAVFDLESPHMAFGRVCLIGDAAIGLRPHVAAVRPGLRRCVALRDCPDLRTAM